MVTRIPSAAIRPTAHVSTARQGGLVVLLDEKSGRFYGLDEVASGIWTMIESGVSFSGIIERISEEFDGSSTTIEADVSFFLQTLLESGLAEPS